ncbi:MAG: hypothetical protein NTW61_09775 [Candidatus Melainabacteria bacterium]|nr:hypothetical protein [Candidatus Melainabacteria bacterium]
MASNTFQHLSPKGSPNYPLPSPEVLFGSLQPIGSVPSPNGCYYLPEGMGHRVTSPTTPNLTPHPAASLTAPVPHSLRPRVPELPPMPLLIYPESPLLPEAFQEPLLPIEEIITPRPYRGNGKYLAANPGNYTGMYQTVNSPTFPFPKDLSR